MWSSQADKNEWRTTLTAYWRNRQSKQSRCPSLHRFPYLFVPVSSHPHAKNITTLNRPQKKQKTQVCNQVYMHSSANVCTPLGFHKSSKYVLQNIEDVMQMYFNNSLLSQPFVFITAILRPLSRPLKSFQILFAVIFSLQTFISNTNGTHGGFCTQSWSHGRCRLL